MQLSVQAAVTSTPELAVGGQDAVGCLLQGRLQQMPNVLTDPAGGEVCIYNACKTAAAAVEQGSSCMWRHDITDRKACIGYEAAAQQ
jgi:hypothetical protein